MRNEELGVKDEELTALPRNNSSFIIPNSAFSIYHALAACAFLGWLVFGKGWNAFWQQFLYGVSQPMTPTAMWQTILMQSIIFGGLLLILWASTKIWRSPLGGVRGATALSAVMLALKMVFPVTVAAFVLSALGASAIEYFWGVKAAEQDMVKWFLDPSFKAWVKGLMIFSVAVQAPVLEELLFRGVILRGFAKSLPQWVAMVASSLVFAIAHTNAASFMAVFFLGMVFAWLYARTHTILAPMVLHCAFNLINVLLLVFLPEAATL